MGEQSKADGMRLVGEIVTDEAELLRKLNSVRKEAAAMKKQLRNAGRSLPRQRRKMTRERVKEEAKEAKENLKIGVLKIKERILLRKIKLNERWLTEMLPQAVTKFGKTLHRQLLRDLSREHGLIHATLLEERRRLQGARRTEEVLTRRLKALHERATNEGKYEKDTKAKFAQEDHQYRQEIHAFKELKKKHLDLLHQKDKLIKQNEKLRSDRSKRGSLSTQNRVYQTKIRQLRSSIQQKVDDARQLQRLAFEKRIIYHREMMHFRNMYWREKAVERRLRRRLRHFKKL